MAKEKLDGVVEAVHYGSDGDVKWVRAYLRRGPTFSDRLIIDRSTLIDYLKAGKKFMAGKRIPLKASTFEVSQPLRLVQTDGHEVLVTGEIKADQDRLESVPII